jgi:endopeptidase Clp ATP-binding regulatory subunit ClpX
MSEKTEGLPTHKELEKELSAYLTKKYGDRIKIISPVVIPQKETFEEENGDETKPKGRAKINFSIKPEELEAFLDQYIVQQANAKTILSTKICTHFNRIRYAQTNPEYDEDIVGAIKNNILLIGSTGVGKTYIIKLIANKIGVPFIKCDATKFSETGYVGGDVEDIIRDLVREANDDIELAECGIVYIDEIDKIAATPHLAGPDVSRSGVQRALLKPMEETEVDLKTPHDPISVLQEIEQYRKTGKRERRTVNTRNILFIMSGAFNDLAEIIKKRMVDRGIGFASTITKKTDNTDFLREAKADDLIEFGFESEFIGRVPVMTVLEKLTEDDLYAILKNPNNPVILNKKRDFKAYGIDVKFSDMALRLLAQKGFAEQTGARGLVSAVEKIIIDFEKKLPSTEIKRFSVTEGVVKNPARELKALLAAPFDPQWDEVFEKIKEEENNTIKTYIAKNRQDFAQRYDLTLSESQLELVALYYTSQAMDVQTVFKQIQLMYTQIKQLEEYFMKSTGIQIAFDDDARDLIASLVVASKKTFGDFYKTLKKDFEYGLRIIQEKTAQQKIILTKEGLENPEQYLNAMMKEEYIDDIEKVFEQHEG